MSLTKIPGTVDFMPPEAMSDASSLEYGIALDVFSFGAVMLHVATQEWPRPLAIKMYDKQKRKPTALTEVERRQPYLDKVTGVTSDLKPLIISCLDDDPSERPSIIEVSENLKKTKKEHSSVSLTTLLDQANEQNKVLESQIVQQAKEIDQLKEEIDHLQNPFQYHNEVQQPDSSTVNNVTQVRSESPCGKSNSLPRREVCSGSPKLTRSKRIHEYEKVDRGINGFNMPQNVARLWQNESILKKLSPNVEVMVTEYASCKSFPRSMQPHHIHKYEDTDDHDSPPDTPSQCQTDLVQSPDIKKDNKLRPKAVLIRRHSSVECEKDLARAQANHWALVKKSSVLDIVKRLYYPLRKHGQKPGNQTTQFTATPPQHQSPKSNRKSDGTATPPKSPPRSNKTLSSLAETPPLPRKDGRHFEGCDEKQPLHDPILDRPPMPTPRSHNKL